jgi:hypothetical protein
MVRKREPEEADWTAARRMTEMKWWTMLTPNDSAKTANIGDAPKLSPTKLRQIQVHDREITDEEQLNARSKPFQFLLNACKQPTNPM